MKVALNGKIIQTPCAWCGNCDPLEIHKMPLHPFDPDKVKICKSCHLGAHCFIDTEHHIKKYDFDFAEFYLESAPMPYYKRVVYNKLRER